jgi:hypothetical protein
MNSIDIAQQVAWFLEAAFPLGIAAIGLHILSAGRTNRNDK